MGVTIINLFRCPYCSKIRLLTDIIGSRFFSHLPYGAVTASIFHQREENIQHIGLPPRVVDAALFSRSIHTCALSFCPSTK